MRVKGAILLILGVAIFASSFFFLGNNDTNAILGGLLMGIGGAIVVSSFVYLFGRKSRMQ